MKLEKDRKLQFISMICLLYAVFSIGIGLFFLNIVTPYTEHDVMWPHYQSLHVAEALANVLQVQHALSPKADHFDMGTSLAAAPYSKTMQAKPAYPRSIMYVDMTLISAAIAGLRRLNSFFVPYMVTQYCWADFSRRWELGHTSARQDRCFARYKTNAAVYFESVMRNINLQEYILNNPSFRLYVADPICGMPGGQTWYDTLYTHEWLSLEAEEALWKDLGFTNFVLQYANRYQIGIQERINVHNALSVHQALVTDTVAVTFRSTLWSTCSLYYCQGDEFAAMNVFSMLAENRSLVRNTPNFFGHTIPSIFEQWVAGLPMTELYSVVHDTIGPLGNIDAFWISPPPGLVQATQSFRSNVLSLMASNTLFAKEFDALRSFIVSPTPIKWSHPSLVFYGGNLLCRYGSPMPFIQQTFGFDDACSTQSPFTIELTSMNVLFAKTMLGDKAGVPCSIVGSLFADCLTYFQHLDTASAMLPATTLNATFLDSLRSLNLSIMQYVGKNNSISIEHQHLLEDEIIFFGMTMLYDWVMNFREAVSMQGDLQTLNLVSYAYSSLSSSTSTSFEAAWTYYVNVSIYIFSIVTASIGMISFILYFASGCPVGCQWFLFNRIVSATWLNRTLIAMRSLVAAVCLSTVPLVPMVNQITQHVHFENQARPWYESAILALESTWSIYIVHDTLHPVFGGVSNEAAPWSCGLAWAILFVMDICAPVQYVANLDRHCYSVNMDYMIYCNSGDISIGSGERLKWIFIIMLLCVTINVAWFYSRKKNAMTKPCTPSLVLPLALVFLERPDNKCLLEEQIDVATAAMSGIFRFKWKKKAYVFDSKLWLLMDSAHYGVTADKRVISLPDCMHFPSEDMNLTSVQPLVLPESRLFGKNFQRLLMFIAGLVYLAMTFTGNVSYLHTVQAYLANDYGWANFNSTGARVFLANVFNQQLLLHSRAELDIATSAFGDVSQTYNGSATTIVWSESMARRRLYDPSIPLTEIIRGLRMMDSCQLPWMFTQYCWLDFDRKFAMASTVARQQRCESEVSNGAVYLESALRNINNWDAWLHCWGDSFEIGIGKALATTTQGREWINSVQHNSNSIEQEVIKWQSHGIMKFVLQWQNYKTVGLRDSMTVATALGHSYPLSLASITSTIHLGQQTSLKMYWSFASDLWAVSTNATYIGGYSLLRSSSNFAFGNLSSESLLYQNLTMVLPLTEGFSLVRDAVGPFNSVDMKYVLCPPSLLKVYGEFMASLSNTIMTNPAAQSEFLSLFVALYMLPHGSNLTSSALTAGGNILCGDDIPPYSTLNAFNTFFSMTSMCHAYFSDVIIPNNRLILFATSAIIELFETPNASNICRLEPSSTSACTNDFELRKEFLTKYIKPPNFNDAFSSVGNLSIDLIQFTTADGNPPISLTRQPLVLPNDSDWSYYTWCFLYEWVAGTREVVSFQGDNGTINALSSSSDPLTLAPNPNDIPQTISFLFMGIVVYITGVLITIAGLVGIAVIISRGNTEFINLFELNRVVGHVWIGRSLLFVRSITAIWLLNTSTLQLTQVGVGTMFITPRLNWSTTILASAESTWFVYVLNDVFSCFTLQYTPTYSMKSSLLAWAATAAWATIWPQQYRAKLHRSCTYKNMDEELQCVSASVEIGSVVGVSNALLIGAGCVALSFVFERWWKPKLPKTTLRTTILNASSYYLLEMTPNIGQYLDKPSGVMAGILCFETRHCFHVFDTKSWRYVTVPISMTCCGEEKLHRIPLCSL